MPQSRKTIVFYSVFALVFAFYGFIVAAPRFGYLLQAGQVMALMASVAADNVRLDSLLGEVTPAALGGIMAFTAPRRASWLQAGVLLLLSGICWLMYVHMQQYLGSTDAATALQLADVVPADVPDVVSSLQSFSTSVRSFAAVIFAAILGIRFNDNVPVLSPNLTTPTNPPPSPPAAGSATSPGTGD